MQNFTFGHQRERKISNNNVDSLIPEEEKTSNYCSFSLKSVHWNFRLKSLNTPKILD